MLADGDARLDRDALVARAKRRVASDFDAGVERRRYSELLTQCCG